MTSNDWAELRYFMSATQLAVIKEGAKGEEGAYFIEKMEEMLRIIHTMPKVYEQDGLGNKAVVYLHYFKGGSDWYITERDTSMLQHQAFGLADPFGDGGEMGYISINHLIQCGVELDLHFQPKTLAEIRSNKEQR